MWARGARVWRGDRLDQRDQWDSACTKQTSLSSHPSPQIILQKLVCVGTLSFPGDFQLDSPPLSNPKDSYIVSVAI